MFTAGVGENSPIIRKMILENMDNLGIVLDEKKNKNPWPYNGVISAENSKVKILVIRTNEELVIAQETLKLTSQK